MSFDNLIYIDENNITHMVSFFSTRQLFGFV